MNDKRVIKTTKVIYPQIYAYVIPDYPLKEGWVKIGYTELKDVDTRIRQQTQTAGIAFATLWSEPAKYFDSDKWFRDSEFHKYLVIFKKVERDGNSEWFYYDGVPEQSLTDFNDFRNLERSQVDKELNYRLRVEQEEAVSMTLDYALSHPDGEFLWNAKPRFGKTLSSYDFARRLNAQRVLIVTNRPAIANSWYDDFEKFIAWQTNYLFVSTTDSLKERPVLTRERYLKILDQTKEGEEYPGIIAFISLQDLKGAISFGGIHNKLRWVKDLDWDLLIIDEAHEGVDTFKTDVAFNNITRSFTLHLSGTPFRAIASGKFSEKQIFNWTYSDEQEAKSLWPQESEENNPYEGLPRLNLFSYQMSQMVTDEVNKGAQIDGMDIDFAFDLNEFFATEDSGKFIHEAEVLKWLSSLTQNEKYPFSTPSLRSELKHTFWILNRVASAKALEKLLSVHPVFENYEIVLAAGDGRTEDDFVVNQKSLDRVREAIEKYERTITLSVGQLTTGVTVPEWTAVLMLSNIQSASLYMQAAFRSQNTWSYDLDGKKRRKENAYVFDFAPERTLIIYDEFANNLNRKTAEGSGTTEEREANVKKLLNFFPVIAEDDEGEMVELDVKQVFTIPRTIKAREVVRRGFMSNLLFQNISGVFSSQEAREILEQLNPVAPGKVTPSSKSTIIDTKDVEVDKNGNAIIDSSLVIATTDARFGEKVYGEFSEVVENIFSSPSKSIPSKIAAAFTSSVVDTVIEIAKENRVSVAQARQVVRQNANVFAREIEMVESKANIREGEAIVELEKEIADAKNDKRAIAEAKERFEHRKQIINEDLEKDLNDTVAEKTKELIKKSTEEILQKSEENKKTTVEDDVRSRLRGFARTIPSFLMAYGEPTTCLANFETPISDSVFTEVTGITIEQFKTLRDKYDFFNPIVFDESIQEFLNKKEELANYFVKTQEEDIFDYVPPQKTNQIFTPKWVVKLMADKLEEESPGIFEDKTKTFVDLYVKSGLYLAEIVRRLFVGLKGIIPDDDARLKHILENQVYGFAPSEIIYNISKNYVYGTFAEIDTKNIKCLDLTETAKAGGALDMKFDVVVGNPPYQESRDNYNYAEPIYPYFYDLAEQIAKRFCIISPARFLFNVGATNKDWNRKMLDNPNLKVVYFNQNSSDLFPNTDIKGGVAVLYYDETKHFGEINVFTSYPELNAILNRVSRATENFDKNLSDIMYVQTKFILSDLYQDYSQFKARLGSNGLDKRLREAVFERLPEVFANTKQSEDDIAIYGRLDNARIYRWIDRKYIETGGNLFSYKVIVAAANGSGVLGEVLSTPIIGKPSTGHTQTFLSIGNFKTKFEAQALLKYVKTKFARTMLGVLKVTQHNQRPTWAKVPLQDFTINSDIDWTKSVPEIDQQLYAKYGLNEEQVAFIEEKVKAME